MSMGRIQRGASWNGYRYDPAFSVPPKQILSFLSQQSMSDMLVKFCTMSKVMIEAVG